mgnify:CR=1 FL=1
MDTKVLEYVISIAEEKNISRAAEQHYLTQPVLSRHLKAIEEDMGTRLFCREKGEMKLTDAGKIYINSARAILYTEKKLMQDLDDLRRNGRRMIRIIVDHYLLPIFNRTILPTFENAQTGLELSVTAGDCIMAVAALDNDLADLAVVKSGSLEENNLERIPLFEDEIVLAVPAAWLQDAGRKEAVRQSPWAFQDRCFLMERTDRVMRQTEQQIMHRFQFRPRIVYEVSGSATALQMVKEEHGVALLQKALVMAHAPEVDFLSFDPPEYFFAYCLYPDRKILREGEKILLRILKDGYQLMDSYLRQLAGEISHDRKKV